MSEIELHARAAKIEQQAACLDANYRTIAEQRLTIGRLQGELKSEAEKSAAMVDELNSSNVKLTARVGTLSEELEAAKKRQDELTRDYQQERRNAETAEQTNRDAADEAARVLIFGDWLLDNYTKLEKAGMLKLPKPYGSTERWSTQSVHHWPFRRMVAWLEEVYEDVSLDVLKLTLKV